MPHSTKGLTIGSDVPEFNLVGTDGRTYSKKSMLGRPYLIYFLRGTW